MATRIKDLYISKAPWGYNEKTREIVGSDPTSFWSNEVGGLTGDPAKFLTFVGHANAHMICAAPKMYKELWDELRFLRFTLTKCVGEWGKQQIQHRIDKIEAVMKEAEFGATSDNN